MPTLSSSIRSFIPLSLAVTLFSVSHACSYVKIASDMAATPMRRWGWAYALDICMEYALVAGQPTYQKYACNDAGEVRLETWDTNTCDGARSASEDPATLGLTVEDFSCDTYGDCDYMMVKNYPTASGDCDDSGVYQEEAILPEVCIATAGTASLPYYTSFKWHCDQTITREQELTMTCPGTDTSLRTGDASAGCLAGSDILSSFMGYWDVTSNGCLSVTYSNPTMNPTTEPTVEPTVVPTSNPSDHPSESPSRNPSESPTRNPSESPSESPSRNPSAAPTDEPTVEPTNGPSKAPSKTPSAMPTMSPSDNPVASETTAAAGDDDDSGASYITLAVNIAIAIGLSLAI